MTNDVVVKITHKEYMELCSKCKTLEAENVAIKKEIAALKEEGQKIEGKKEKKNG